MRITALLLAAAAASPSLAQISVYPAPSAPRTLRAFSNADEPRAVIGIVTTGGATNRDTLGLLVSSVRAGSPAEKAGIEEGNRIASINGVSLKLSPADVSEYEMAGVMTRRLTRELNKLKPGDEVDLRVYTNGQTRAVKVKTVAREDLNETTAFRRDGDRATLGVSIATTGSSRDTIGVFVMSVDDGSPAAKAGIEEGNRIASINGVDLRGRRSKDDDDFVFRTSTASRLEREMWKVKPGDDVDLRVYANGQYRNVKVKAGKASDLPNRGRAITIMRGGDGFAMPPMPPMAAERFEIEGQRLGDELRRTIGSAVGGATTLARTMPGFLFGNRVSW